MNFSDSRIKVKIDVRNDAQITSKFSIKLKNFINKNFHLKSRKYEKSADVRIFMKKKSKRKILIISKLGDSDSLQQNLAEIKLIFGLYWASIQKFKIFTKNTSCY